LGCEIRGNGGGFPVLASPASFGHGGATGCLLWIDPAHESIVAFVSNRHYRADPDGFELRLERIVNTTLACLTR
jgi:CubicO group peptidase (beta-lactamase class C family)